VASAPHYNSFWVTAFIPEQSTPAAMKKKIDEWKASLAKTLAEYMMSQGAMDLSMTYSVCEKTGKPGYVATAQTLLTNPKIAIDNDVFAHERLRMFAEEVDWKDDDLKDAFYALLDIIKPATAKIH
jgi:hypothetical protein